MTDFAGLAPGYVAMGSFRRGKPTPGQIGHELRPEDGPFKVEVALDHSDDCGTVYRLKPKHFNFAQRLELLGGP